MGKGWFVAAALLAFACSRGTGGEQEELGGGPMPPLGADGGTEDPADAGPFEPAWPAQAPAIEPFSLSFSDEAAPYVYDPIYGGKVYVPGVFGARGVEHAVELRQRGQGAREHPKHSWKVRFPEGTLFDGARKLNFLAEWLDAGYLTDMLSYRLMRAAGVHASETRYATLTVNDEFQGIYTQVEQVDKWFLRRRGLDPDANIYRCGEHDCEMKLGPLKSYQKPWEKETNESEPSDDLDAFLWALSRTPEGEFEAWLEQNFDVENYLRYLAAMAVLSGSGVDDSGNYFIHEPARGRWTFAPWDMNNSLMLYWRSEPVDAPPRVDRPLCIFTAYDRVNSYEWKQKNYGDAHRAFSVLNQRIWDRPALRARVLDQVERLAAGVFSPAAVYPEIEAIHALIRDELPRDPWVNLPNALRAPDYLKEYVTGRLDFLAQEIPRERRRGEGGLVINALGAAGGERRDERGEADAWIEIFNREETEADLEGLVITDSLREEFKHPLPAGLVVPPRGRLVLWADGQAEQGAAHLPFRIDPQGGELGLFDGKTRWGLVDALYYAPMEAGREYGRTPDGSEDWGWRR